MKGDPRALSPHAVARHEIVAMAAGSESVTLSRFGWVARWTALSLVAALFCLPFVAPIRRPPIASFDCELLSVILLASALIAAGFCGGRLKVSWPIPVFLLSILSLGLLHDLLGWLDYSYQLKSLAMWVIAVLSAYCLGRWFAKEAWQTLAVTAVCGALVVGGLVSFVVQVLQVLDISTISRLLVFRLERSSSLQTVANLGQPNHLALYLALALVGAVYLFRLRARLLGCVLVGVFAAGIALTLSRMGLMMIVVVAAAMLVASAKYEMLQRRFALAVVTCIFLGYGLGWIAGPLLMQNVEVATTVGDRLWGSTYQYRIVLWVDALKVILQNPVLGVGTGNYPSGQYWVSEASEDTLSTQHAHNVFLQVAAEFGVPIAIALVCLCIWWIRGNARELSPARLTVALFIALIGIHSLLEWPLWILFIAIPTGFLVGLVEPKAKHSLQIDSRAVLLPLGLAGLLCVPVMVLDYDRVSVAFQRLYQEEAKKDKRLSLEASVGFLEIGDATFFKPQIERQLLFLMRPEKPVYEETIAMTRRVLGRLPDPPVIARYITLLVLAGRVDEAVPHVERMRAFSRNSERYFESEQIILKGIASEGPKADKIRAELAAHR